MHNHRLGVALALALAACGGGGISIDDYPGKLEDARCKNAVACGEYPDSKTCHDAIVFAGNDYESTLDAVDKGTVKFDEGAAKDCADETASASCNFEGIHGTSPCNDVFEGTIPMGGACTIDLECAGGAACTQTDQSCDRDTACCPGTCGEPAGTQSVAIGGTCKDSTDCVTSAYCKAPASGTGDGTCTALITTEGAACDDLYACADPMICDVIFSDMPTCEKSAASGATCNPNYLIPCADLRDYCDPTSMKCTRTAAVGAMCSDAIPCIGYATCENGTCVAQPGLNATCTADGPSCLGSLDCMNGTCQPPAAGMSCIN